MAYEDCPKCGSRKHQLNACKQCGYTRSGESNRKTQKRSSLNENKATKVNVTAGTQTKTGIKKHKKRKNKARNKKTRIILISKRGTRIVGRYACTNCGKEVDNATRYVKSNRGVVVLCASCKAKIRCNSFPQKKIDALDYATTGGGFESNRRRY